MKLGKHLNEIFCRDGLPERFISPVYFELEVKTGKIRILNAGHLSPIIMKNHSIKEMDQGRVALGIKPNIQYKEQRIELRSGGLFIVYSDGLTEARNATDEFFGEECLLCFLKKLETHSAKEIGQCLVDEVDQFVDDAKVSDNLSLVIIKRSS